MNVSCSAKRSFSDSFASVVMRSSSPGALPCRNVDRVADAAAVRLLEGACSALVSTAGYSGRFGLPACFTRSLMASVRRLMWTCANSSAFSMSASATSARAASTMMMSLAVPATIHVHVALVELRDRRHDDQPPRRARRGTAATARGTGCRTGTSTRIRRSAPARRHRSPGPTTMTVAMTWVSYGKSLLTSGRMGRSISRELSTSFSVVTAFTLEETRPGSCRQRMCAHDNRR